MIWFLALLSPLIKSSLSSTKQEQRKSLLLHSTGCPKKTHFQNCAAPPNPPASIHILRVNIQIHPAKIWMEAGGLGGAAQLWKCAFLGHPVVQHQVRFVFANVWDDSPILNLRYISWKHCGDWRISSPRDKLADCGLNGRSEGGQHLGEEKDKNSIW